MLIGLATISVCFDSTTPELRLVTGICTVQFNHSVVSDSLRLHGLQHTRLPCPSHNSQSLLKVMSIELVMPSNHLILCHPLLLLPSVFPSIRIFSSEKTPVILCIRLPKYWSFSFSISPSNEYPGLISFRMDWFESHANVHEVRKGWKVLVPPPALHLGQDLGT